MPADRLLVRDSLPGNPFGTEIVVFRHRMHESGLFEDENLVRMIAEHPRELIAVSTMGDVQGTGSWSDCDHTGIDAEMLLDCVRRGHLWLTLRRFTDHQPELTRLLNRAYDELEQHDSTLRTTRRDGSLLVSSPTAFVHYHVDVPPNVLWHLRGRKRVWAYSADDPELLSPDVRDAVVARERVEDVPYDPSFDAKAVVHDLDPGDVVTWPQNSPHRVVNLDGLNVSISSEHFTPQALRAVRVRRANRWLLHRFGWSPKSTRTDGVAYRLKTACWAAGYLAEKCLGVTKPEFDYPQTFRVDPMAERCLAPLGEESTRVATTTMADDAEPVLVGQP